MMGTATFPIYFDGRDRLRGSFLLSLVLHGALFLFALGYTILGPRLGGKWGNSWGAGGATRVSAVASLPGVPLPAPMRSTRSTLATENPGLYKAEPEPKVEPPPKAAEIPKFQRRSLRKRPFASTNESRRKSSPRPRMPSLMVWVENPPCLTTSS